MRPTQLLPAAGTLPDGVGLAAVVLGHDAADRLHPPCHRPRGSGAGRAVSLKTAASSSGSMAAIDAASSGAPQPPGQLGGARRRPSPWVTCWSSTIPISSASGSRLEHGVSLGVAASGEAQICAMGRSWHEAGPVRTCPAARRGQNLAMHIPAKVDYGIRALLALAAAGTPQTAEYLAGEQGLPPASSAPSWPTCGGPASSPASGGPRAATGWPASPTPSPSPTSSVPSTARWPRCGGSVPRPPTTAAPPRISSRSGWRSGPACAPCSRRSR